MSCFCQRVKSLISHCFADRQKNKTSPRTVSVHRLIFVQGNSISVRTAGDIEETEFSPPVFFSLLDTSRLRFPFIRAINQSIKKRGALCYGRGWNGAGNCTFFNITSNASMHLSQSQLQKHTAVLIRFTLRQNMQKTPNSGRGVLGLTNDGYKCIPVCP